MNHRNVSAMKQLALMNKISAKQYSNATIRSEYLLDNVHDEKQNITSIRVTLHNGEIYRRYEHGSVRIAKFGVDTSSAFAKESSGRAENKGT